MEDTIVAISTSVGEGAISIIRLSGHDALNIASKVFTKEEPCYECIDSYIS